MSHAGNPIRTPVRAGRRTLLLTALLTATACTFDDGLPATLHLRCQTDDHCPAGYTCWRGLDRCVALEGLDDRPPALVGEVELRIDGRVDVPARIGAAVQLRFVIDEALERDPVVVATGRTETIDFEVHEAATERRSGRYAYVYRAVGTEAQEYPFTLFVELTDRNGNPARGLSAGLLRFDFKPPELQPDLTILDPLVARPATEVSVQVAASETIDAGLELIRIWGRGEARYVARVLAANVASFVFVPDEAEGDGPQALRLRGLRDLAGNRASGEIELTTFVLDSTRPAIDRLATDRTTYSAAPGFSEIRGSFAVDVLPAALTLAVGEALLACTVSSSGDPLDCLWSRGSEPLAEERLQLTCGPEETPWHCSFTYLIEEDDTIHGSRNIDVTVNATDQVGNTGRTSLRLVYDFTAPSIAPDAVELAITPAVGSPVTTALHLGAGGTAMVFFATDEPILTPADLELRGPDGLPVAGGWLPRLVIVDSSRYSIAIDPGPGPVQQGRHTLHLTLEDLVGNIATVAIPLPDDGLCVDTEPPPAPALEEMELLRYPWGAEASHGRRAMQLETGLSEDGCLPLSTADPTSGEQLCRQDQAPDRICGGHLLVGEDASFGDPPEWLEMGRCRLGPTGDCRALWIHGLDRLSVQARVVDLAGQVSAASQVLHGTWVAGLGREAIDDNPHRHVISSHLEPHLALSTDSATGHQEQDGTALELTDGEVATAGVAGRLIPTYAGAAPLASSSPYNSGFDLRRGRLLTIGSSRRTLEWDGMGWSQLASPALPSGGDRGSTTYNRWYGELFTFSDDRSLWHLDRGTWQRFAMTPPVPSATGSELVYTGDRDEMLLFGGIVQGLPSDATWVWHTEGWIPIEPDDPWPAPRAQHAMAYDSTRRQVVLFGGSGCADPDCGSRHDLNDTWIWDGATWSEATPDVSPTARHGHRMVYDELQREVLLVGGCDDDNTQGLRDEFWWDGDDWRPGEFLVSGSRCHHELVRDPIGRRTLLFGGLSGQVPRNRLWSRSDDGWRLLESGAQLRGSNLRPAMTYDAGREEVLLYVQQRLFAWDGLTWSEHQPAESSAPEQESALVYDPVAEESILFGGSIGTDAVSGTWIWREAWSRIETGSSPPPTTHHAMAWDAIGGRVLMFGGIDPALEETPRDETWTYGDQAWSLLVPAESPPPRCRHTMAADLQSGRIVLFGGDDLQGNLLADTWEWDGDSWHWRTDQGPSPRFHSVMAYNPELGQVVLYGGNTTFEELGDVWVWDSDSGSWRPLATFGAGTGALPSVESAAATAHIGTGQWLLVAQARTWLFDHTGQPAHRLMFDLGDSPLLAPGLQIDAVGCRAIAGGLAGARAGAELMLWGALGWQVEQENDADPLVPSALDVVITPTEIPVEELVTRGAVYWAIRPLEPAENATVILDYAELQISYTIVP